MNVTRKGISIDKARVLLRDQWCIVEEERPFAYLLDPKDNAETRSSADGKHWCNLSTWPEIGGGNDILTKNHTLFEMLWPISLFCQVDLADFYWKGEEPQYPLGGFRIPELLDVTKYPFSYPDRILVIPTIRHSTYRVQVGVSQPTAIIFVEPWSHFDNYDTSKYHSPEEAFAPTTPLTFVDFFQSSDVNWHIGCNFFIMPMGYDYTWDSWSRKEEAKSHFRSNAWEWQEILQKFFGGEVC